MTGGTVPKPQEDFGVENRDQALMLLGALERMPSLFRLLPAPDWLVAAGLMRHPGRRQAALRPLPEHWGFQFDAKSGEAWWTGQDEDSVH